MAVNWMMLATAFITIGFELIVFGLAMAPTASFESSDHAVESLEVCGFLCLLISFIVIMFMQYGDLKGRRSAAAVVIGGSFLGGNQKYIFMFLRACHNIAFVKLEIVPTVVTKHLLTHHT